ncbi:translation initiation factor 2 [Pseudomonas fragi]|uniref:translation initiation factor 2 n=1 Tax=Pseudomonas fragi TaxID=296 RepID=UPI001F172819|nr:translation initiation factor 2 [Pseudomonas fragi]MCF6759917.1 translation initiation factor 2 [Pseudomonas fragi]MCK6253314.1 translation initiation factor 2 [Pseudomonas fragi]
MKATYCASLVLMGVLGALNAMVATAAPVQPASTSAQTQSVHSQAKPSVSEKSTPVKKREPIASKSKPAHEIAKKPLPAAKLDLRLPPEMVKQLRPLGTVPMPAHKPLLPNMFGEKSVEESPFQLNGRLLSNEMDLQLRNEYRHNEIEGAALDFEFKQ